MKIKVLDLRYMNCCIHSKAYYVFLYPYFLFFLLIAFIIRAAIDILVTTI